MENQKIRFSFTLSRELQAELKRLAELEELSEAAYLRRLIRFEAQKFFTDRPKGDFKTKESNKR